MKKLMIGFLALTMCFALCACGGRGDLAFKNDLNVKIYGIYFSPSTSLIWSDHWNSSPVRSGGTAYVNFKDLEGDGDGASYDIGVVDENNINYDSYGIVLHVGDKITLSGDEDEAVYIVTSADGDTEEYDCIVYSGDDQG